MRRAFLILGLIAAVGLSTSAAVASTDVTTTRDVKIEILPAIVIAGAGVSQTQFQPDFATNSIVYLDVPFKLDANKQQLYFQTWLTELFKADDPTNPDNVPPLTPCDSVLLYPEFGIPLQPMSGIATIEASGEFETDDQIRQMVLTITPDGRAVRLGDVSEVKRTFREPPEPLARLNGQRAVVVIRDPNGHAIEKLECPAVCIPVDLR